MTKEKCSCYSNNACGGAIYGIGLIGAIVYYIQQASNFTEGLVGVLKAMVWPALLVYRVLQNFQM